MQNYSKLQEEILEYKEKMKIQKRQSAMNSPRSIFDNSVKVNRFIKMFKIYDSKNNTQFLNSLQAATIIPCPPHMDP
jgi:hypothetical protein